jgi:hypothetical protein
MLTSSQLKKMRRFTELGELPCTAKAEARMGLPAVAIVPTQQVILTGGTLPAWQQADPTQWVWTPASAAANPPAVATNAPTVAANAPAVAANAPAVAAKATAPAVKAKVKIKN